MRSRGNILNVARRTATLLLAVTLCATLLTAASARKKKADRSTAASTAELVWPLPPDPPRIRYVDSLSGSADYRKKGKRWRRVLLGAEPERGVSLFKPYGVTTDDKGRVYVTDTGHGAVLVFDEQQREVRTIGLEGRLRLATPIGIAVDGQGRIFVADADLDLVFLIAADGSVESALGRAEGLRNPTGLAIDPQRGRLLVVDSHRHELLIYSLEGEYVTTWGARGSAEGQFNYPTNVALDAAGNVYVVDTGNFRVQVFDPQGEPLRAFGQAGDALGNFTRPKGIALDGDGHAYVVDAAFNNFQIFDRSNRLLLFVGSYGKQPGQFWLPAGIHVDKRDRIYVVDQINRRIQIFQYLGGGKEEQGG